MAESQRVGGYPKHDEGSFPLLVIFDDSLHNRWSVPPEGLQPEFDDTMDVGRLRGGHRVHFVGHGSGHSAVPPLEQIHY